MSKWFSGWRRSATKRWGGLLAIEAGTFAKRRKTPMRELVEARYLRRARALRQTGDEHDFKMAAKLIRRCAA